MSGGSLRSLRDEALEQHAHARRIDLGDADAETHDRVRRAAAALAEDVLRLREAHDVGDGQEVVLVLQFADQLELVLDLRLAPWPACPCGQRRPAPSYVSLRR